MTTPPQTSTLRERVIEAAIALTTITAGLRDNPSPTHDEAREMVAGNLCRCTGYQNIVAAVERASVLQRAQRARDAAVVEEVAQRPSRDRVTDAGTPPGADYEDRDDDNASTGLGA